ncbi:MAG: hypothetical protein LBP26_05800, partial [Clostridiales bacterium]|nr:hypothetical protein [Clostridiales bacterium]
IDPENDKITLLNVKSSKSVIVDATIDQNAQAVVLNFKSKGSSVITVWLTDETGRQYDYSFTVENIDLPAPSFFVRIAASVQSKPVAYIVGLVLFVVLLIILIAIIAAARKRKRMREEIEALLVSEMELEEQMLRLAAGPSPTFYQSYGFLSPTRSVQNNPGFMLGDGRSNPTPNPNVMGLNAGAGQPSVGAGPAQASFDASSFDFDDDDDDDL